MERETVVLCGANSYEQKYYFNRDFAKLPEGIQQELQVMCVLFTEDVDSKEYKKIWGYLTIGFTGLLMTHMLSGLMVAVYAVAACLVMLK